MNNIENIWINGKYLFFNDKSGLVHKWEGREIATTSEPGSIWIDGKNIYYSDFQGINRSLNIITMFGKTENPLSCNISNHLDLDWGDHGDGHMDSGRSKLVSKSRLFDLNVENFTDRHLDGHCDSVVHHDYSDSSHRIPKINPKFKNKDLEFLFYKLLEAEKGKKIS